MAVRCPLASRDGDWPTTPAIYFSTKGLLYMAEKCVDWIKKEKKITVVFTNLTRATLTELGITAIIMSQILGLRMFVKVCG